ncbi:type II secretion system F family protein [Aquabacterium sp.]|uniref:type II secretion system F family protein n=1 Tax=Aquabacterium sp. TaxID=1872578 RepID=UPI00248A61DB|nr:type II secretion system F family protein [Aquabacterium sp.]MDI1351011.1 type II secretion system F family protein [Aquabacterium sp.]
MTMLWLLLALMLFGLAAVLLMLTREDGIAPEAEKRFNEVLETPDDVSWMTQRRWRRTNSLSDRFRRVLERIPGTDMQEIELLMRQAGLVDDRTRARVYASLWMAPLGLAALGLLAASFKGWPMFQSGFAGLTIGFIGSRKVLRWLAERRRQAVREEMPIVLNLMRLLFDAGLSLEHTLKAIGEQGKHITPHLASEFSWVLQRIQHGQERGDALEDMARRLDVDELTATVSILKQAARYGGNLRDSLMRYIKLMEDRRMTELRDKVGKMSAKMSVVMMLFMFPALILFLAGPGFMAVVRTLKSI